MVWMANQSLNKLCRISGLLNKTRQVSFFPWNCSELFSFLPIFFFFLKKSVTRIDVLRKADLISPGWNRRFFTKFDVPRKIKELGAESFLTSRFAQWTEQWRHEVASSINERNEKLISWNFARSINFFLIDSLQFIVFTIDCCFEGLSRISKVIAYQV